MGRLGEEEGKRQKAKGKREEGKKEEVKSEEVKERIGRYFCSNKHKN